MKILFLHILLALCSVTALTSCNSDDDLNVILSPYDQYGSPFSNMPKPKDAIIYQVNLRAFSEAGTIEGVRERLSHIKSLGANVIYLMPSGRSFKFCGRIRFSLFCKRLQISE